MGKRALASRARRVLIAASLVWLCVQPAAAQDSPPVASAPLTGLSPSYFWLCSSASLLTASLGGLSALRVYNYYRRAGDLAAVAPERASFVPRARSAEITADALFAGAAVLAIASVVLALHTDWSRAERALESDSRADTAQREHGGPKLSLAPLANRYAAGLWLRGEWL